MCTRDLKSIIDDWRCHLRLPTFGIYRTRRNGVTPMPKGSKAIHEDLQQARSRVDAVHRRAQQPASLPPPTRPLHLADAFTPPDEDVLRPAE